MGMHNGIDVSENLHLREVKCPEREQPLLSSFMSPNDASFEAPIRHPSPRTSVLAQTRSDGAPKTPQQHGAKKAKKATHRPLIS